MTHAVHYDMSLQFLDKKVQYNASQNNAMEDIAVITSPLGLKNIQINSSKKVRCNEWHQVM